MTLRTNFVPILTAVLAAASLLAGTAPPAAAQAEHAAYGPGSYTQVGAVFSDYQIDYGHRDLGGASMFADTNLYRRIGAEAEARVFRLNQDQGVHETTYLAGPRVSFLAGRFRPYTKLLLGRGEFYFPFNYAKGSYFVVAPGFGIDWHVRNSRFAIRVVDVEIQNWPGFTFGPLKPYGISSGIAYRIF